MKKIISLVLNSVTHDSRVKKTANTLSSFGRVSVVGFRYHIEDSPVLDKGSFVIDRCVLYNKSKLGVRKKFSQLSATIRIFFYVLRRYRDADVVVCNDLETLPIGIALKYIRNKELRIIYDSHEYQAETKWQSPIRKRFTRAIERWAIRHADASVVVSPSIANEYSRIYQMDPPFVVMNCPMLSRVQRTGRLREALGISESSLIFLYQGGLSAGRGIEVTVETFRRLEGRDCIAVFMGYGPLESWLQSVERECETVRVMPAVPPEEVLEYTSDADFGLCLIENVCLNYYYCLPNKLFEYLMAGVPVVVSNLYELERFVRLNGVGVVATSDDVRGIRKAIDDALLLDRVELNGRIDSIRPSLSWESQEEVWHRVMQRISLSQLPR